ncbi:hypothetical protein K474DRAFT_862871 [Panus rudis PR-1116 ss-1]|nr:hypothetical protein K474DRAFT_862871 [Panus rudis PR-1116 ss-1]
MRQRRATYSDMWISYHISAYVWYLSRYCSILRIIIDVSALSIQYIILAWYSVSILRYTRTFSAFLCS